MASIASATAAFKVRMRRRFWILLLSGLVVFGGRAALADASAFLAARIVEQSEVGTVVEFAFAQDVRANVTNMQGDRIEIRLRPSSAQEWDAVDESYHGDLGAIERVTIDGNAAAGYRVVIRLGWPMAIELMPQRDDRRVTLRLTKLAAPERAQFDVPAVPVNAARTTALVAEPASLTPSGDDEPVGVVVPTAEPASSDPFERALADGKSAAMAKDYDRAIGLFTKAADSTDIAVRQAALESLGTARERNQQDAQAKLLYEQFLKQYPDSDLAPTIRQRLSGIVTRDLPVQRKLKVAARDSGAWTVAGNVGQFYQRYEMSVNGDRPVIGVDGLFTNADIIVGHRSDHFDLGLRVSSNSLTDFSGDGDSTQQMSTAYLEAQQIDWGVDVRVGRQSQQSNGVLGRFDGVRVQYKVNPWLRFGAIGGYAVDYSANAFSDQRPLYGVNAGISVHDGMLEFAPFYIEQQANGLLDRRAVGMETRFFRENISVFSLLDYDTYHEEWNTKYLMFNLRFDDGWSTYATFDHRRSPYITMENALIGQGVTNLGTLENTYSDQQIQELANDRTAELTMASIGIDKEISSRLQVGTDFSYSDYSSTPASGNVAATPSQQANYYALRVQLNEAYGEQTFAALLLRVADGTDTRTTSVYWNNRFTFDTVWQLYPRLRVDYTQFTNVGQTQWFVEPSMRLAYRPKQNMYLELDAGYQRTQRDMAVQSMEIVGYYVRLGYRSLF